MRVIVCGGRDFTDHALIRRTLRNIHAETPIKHIFHGNARGADTIAGNWGYEKNIPTHSVPAQWKKYGRRAGPIRNQNMLGQGIDLVIAFPGGKGTADMVKRAKRDGVRVLEIGAQESGDG